jgi:hypothetical protein
MLSSNTSRFVLVIVAAFVSTVSSHGGIRGLVHASDNRAHEPVVELGFAGSYVILTKAGISIITDAANSGPSITGNIAVSPIAGTAMTGFGFTAAATAQWSTSPEITGKAFAPTDIAPTPGDLTPAVGAMETAYTNAKGRTNTDAARINIETGILGVAGEGSTSGSAFTYGVYTYGSDVNINGDIYLSGTDTDVFIIQIAGKLTVNANVLLWDSENNIAAILGGSGVQAENVFWQVAEAVEVGENAIMEGVILAQTSVLFKEGSQLYGRVLAQTRCDLEKATITQPAGVPDSTPWWWTL